MSCVQIRNASCCEKCLTVFVYFGLTQKGGGGGGGGLKEKYEAKQDFPEGWGSNHNKTLCGG